MSRSEIERLRDLREALERVVRLVGDLDMETFVADEATYYAAVYSLGIAGEAAKSLSEETKAMSESTDWRAIGRLRDILFHVYFGISNEILWDVIKKSVPGTIAEVVRIQSVVDAE